MDKSRVQFYPHGALREKEDRTYEDVLWDKLLAVRQAFSFDLDEMIFDLDEERCQGCQEPGKWEWVLDRFGENWLAVCPACR